MNPIVCRLGRAIGMSILYSLCRIARGKDYFRYWFERRTRQAFCSSYNFIEVNWECHLIWFALVPNHSVEMLLSYADMQFIRRCGYIQGDLQAAIYFVRNCLSSLGRKFWFSCCVFGTLRFLDASSGAHFCHVLLPPHLSGITWWARFPTISLLITRLFITLLAIPFFMPMLASVIIHRKPWAHWVPFVSVTDWASFVL